MLNTQLSFKKKKMWIKKNKNKKNNKKKKEKKNISTNISSIFTQVSAAGPWPGRRPWSPGVKSAEAAGGLSEPPGHRAAGGPLVRVSRSRGVHEFGGAGPACFAFTGRSQDPRFQPCLPWEPPPPRPAPGSDASGPGPLPSLRSCRRMSAGRTNASQQPPAHSRPRLHWRPSRTPLSLGQCPRGSVLPEPPHSGPGVFLRARSPRPRLPHLTCMSMAKASLDFEWGSE